MKYIELTQGYSAIIDDDYYHVVIGFKWQYDHGYARCWVTDGVKKRRLYMHHLILPVKRVDHINGNKLDNRRENLREVTQRQNCFNHSKNKNNTSGFKGVSWHNQNGNWRAYISVGDKFISLGSYKAKEEAAQAYNEAAKRHFGEYAKLNHI